MSIHMKGRSIASLGDLTREEIEQILKTSELLKLQLLRAQDHPLIKGDPELEGVEASAILKF